MPCVHRSFVASLAKGPWLSHGSWASRPPVCSGPGGVRAGRRRGAAQNIAQRSRRARSRADTSRAGRAARRGHCTTRERAADHQTAPPDSEPQTIRRLHQTASRRPSDRGLRPGSMRRGPRCGRAGGVRQQRSCVLHAGRALEERDGQVANECHYRTHEAIARAAEQRARPPHQPRAPRTHLR